MFRSKRSSKTTSSRQQPTPVTPSTLRNRVTRSGNGRETRNQMVFYSQLLGLVRSGFDRIEATLRLGLGIDEPAARITELEAQVAELKKKNAELEALVSTSEPSEDLGESDGVDDSDVPEPAPAVDVEGKDDAARG